MSIKIIEHSGIIRSIDNTNIEVIIENAEACVSCQVKNICSVGDKKEKIIEIYNCKEKYEPGENVIVTLEQSKGLNALFLGYILPFMILVLTMIITSSLSTNQGLAGILSLLILVPYYIILYYFRDKLKKTFTFKIRKI